MPVIVLYSVDPGKESEVAKVASLIHEQSWGVDFPFSAAKFLAEAEHIIVARDVTTSEIVGSAALTRHQGCPDDYANKDLFFVCLVVHENYRGQNLGQLLQRDVIVQAKKMDTFLYATIDNLPALQSLVKEMRWYTLKKWKKVRKGKNEDGSDFDLYRLRL